MKFRLVKVALTALTISLSGLASATLIDFTGGTVLQNNGAVGTTNNYTSIDNTASYVEDGYKFEFFFTGSPGPMASSVGNYYGSANDVIHWHWADSGFGEVTELKVSKVDGSLFNLGGFAVTTNTSTGGGASSGTEQVSVNTSKALGIFDIAPDDWGLGAGPDPLITIDPSNLLFSDISWFSFTNATNSTAKGMGLDLFYLNEAGDPNGTAPTLVSEPTTLAIFMLGMIGLISRRFKK